jgi:glycosyltransferase involved in cell wall biosynthesis
MRKNATILMTGLFVSPKNKDLIYRTASDQLAEVLAQHQYKLIKTSTQVNKYFRALDILSTIFLKTFSYKIAIVPYYGSSNAFIIENWSTRLLKLLGKKIILVVHGGGLPSRLALNANKYLSVLDRATEVVCPSPYLQHELKQYGIISSVVENVVKLSDYTFTAKDSFAPRLLWMRAFSDIYNPEMAVRVFAEVKKKLPNATMIMAGKDLGTLPNVKALATELNVIESIQFPGYIHTEQKNELATQTDIYLCTNRIDNAPVTFIEMMALGLPIVSVNIGGIPFIVTHEHNGLLVNLDDDIAMANAIISLTQNAAFAKKIVANGLQTAAKYDEAVVVKKWQQLLIN